MMRSAGSFTAVFLLVAGGFFVGLGQARARVPVDVATLAHAGAAASFNLEVDSFTVACATSATQIKSSDGRPLASFSCVNTSATDVAVGDSSLAAPASANSPVISTTAPAGAVWAPDANGGYCRVDAGTVTLYCSGLVPAS